MERQAPSGMKTWTEINYSVSIRAHKVDHLARGKHPQIQTVHAQGLLVHSRNHRRSHSQAQLTHLEVEVSIAHGHNKRRQYQSAGINVSPLGIDSLVLHEGDDQVQKDRAGEPGAIGHKFEDPDA